MSFVDKELMNGSKEPLMIYDENEKLVCVELWNETPKERRRRYLRNVLTFPFRCFFVAANWLIWNCWDKYKFKD